MVIVQVHVMGDVVISVAHVLDCVFMNVVQDVVHRVEKSALAHVVIVPLVQVHAIRVVKVHVIPLAQMDVVAPVQMVVWMVVILHVPNSAQVVLDVRVVKALVELEHVPLNVHRVVIRAVEHAKIIAAHIVKVHVLAALENVNKHVARDAQMNVAMIVKVTVSALVQEPAHK